MILLKSGSSHSSLFKWWSSVADRFDGLRSDIASIVTRLGYECVGVEIVRTGASSTLRVYIDTPGGVHHEECERVSRSISELLDESETAGREWFRGSYFVEVSSPGVERPLFTADHYRSFIGRLASVTMKGKKIRGTIEAVSDEGVLNMSLEGSGDEISIDIAQISRGHLVFVMGKGEKKGHGRGSKRAK